MTTRLAALLIDDDARLGALVAEYLGQHEIDVVVAGDGERGLGALRKRRFDVVLLDLMLPGVDGLEVCRRIRAAPEWAGVPVVMLTARGEEVDRIVGLELGADDYLPKPFEPRELLARIRAILRRRTDGTPAPAKMMRFGSLEIDRDARTVTVAGKPVDLTSYQFDLLVVLAERAGRVLTRDQIMEQAHHRSWDVFDRSIDLRVMRLRRKIETNPDKPEVLKTVRNVGYVFVPAPAEPD